MLQKFLRAKARYEKNIKWIQEWYPFDDMENDAFRQYMAELKSVILQSQSTLSTQEVNWLEKEIGEKQLPQLLEGVCLYDLLQV